MSCSPHLRSGFIFHKIPKRNTGVKLHDFCFSSRISGHQKHKQQKKKQTYRTHWSQNCVSADIIKKVKRQPTEQEKILSNSVSDKGLVSRLYKEHNSTTKHKCCNEEPYAQGVLHVWADLQNKFSEGCVIFWFCLLLPNYHPLRVNCGFGEDSRVPWTARRSNQSILKEINPEYSLKGLMLKLKLQYFGHWYKELTH